MPSRYPHLLFLQWLSIALAVLFGFYLAWDYDLISALFENDKSYISSIIIIIFFLTTVAAGFRVVFLSRELEKAAFIADTLRRHCGDIELKDDGALVSRDTRLPGCLLQEQLFKQIMRRQCSEQSTGSHLMLENMEKRITENHDFGWLIADMMIKLGLLGTVIGFIFMLGSVATIDNADIATIQNMLVDMSAGMRIALFTTLTGLLGGMLLGLQYHFLDRGAGRLMGIVSDTIETYMGH
ncbi:MAG: MotA/TolQ/ExbB proton channel family protein [Gammaproteobacteria bacterium]|nr:MotA/TolQ/ExbB proton channel family protein [Gammaproteobacteria bacterium]